MNKALIPLLLGASLTANAQQIETIVVIGNTTKLESVDQVVVTSLIESLQPTQVSTVGGIGGFASFTERGTQASHTAVFRNGVMANDAGAGWYDIGHDLATGNEQVKVVTGPQGVLYGTSSMGGTVFINDRLTPGVTVKAGNNIRMASATLSDNINFTYADVENGSVRSDNTELDRYTQSSVRLQSDPLWNDFVVNYSVTDYSYDYDNCYTADWTPSNDCVQQGLRQTLSVRNDNITLGYNSNTVEYFTADYQSYDTDAENYFFDVRDELYSGKSLSVLMGITATQENYIGESQNSLETYTLVSYQDWLDFGARYTDDTTVARVGVSVLDATITASTSYRNPNLYELNGDGAWVFANTSLQPEKGAGVELSYGPFTAFRYDFSQGIDFNFTNSTYVNTGDYQTQGIRFNDAYDIMGGEFSVFAGYTDTDQLRVPEYKYALTYTKHVGDYRFSVNHVVQRNRGQDWNGEQLDDVSSSDVFVSYRFDYFTVSGGIENLFNNDYEVAPGYNNRGRQIILTVTTK